MTVAGLDLGSRDTIYTGRRYFCIGISLLQVVLCPSHSHRTASHSHRTAYVRRVSSPTKNLCSFGLPLTSAPTLQSLDLHKILSLAVLSFCLDVPSILYLLSDPSYFPAVCTRWYCPTVPIIFTRFYHFRLSFTSSAPTLHQTFHQAYHKQLPTSHQYNVYGVQCPGQSSHTPRRKRRHSSGWSLWGFAAPTV